MKGKGSILAPSLAASSVGWSFVGSMTWILLVWGGDLIIHAIDTVGPIKWSFRTAHILRWAMASDWSIFCMGLATKAQKCSMASMVGGSATGALSIWDDVIIWGVAIRESVNITLAQNNVESDGLDIVLHILDITCSVFLPSKMAEENT